MTTSRLLLLPLLLVIGISAPAPALADEADFVEAKPKRKAAPVKKKADPYEKSKYKSRELSEGEQKVFRFNEKGEPVLPKAKKKSSPKKKAQPPEEEPVPACSAEKPCAKPDEADAL